MNHFYQWPANLRKMLFGLTGRWEFSSRTRASCFAENMYITSLWVLEV